jgi:predicted lipase
VPYPGCKGCEVHVGFLEDYRIIEEKVNRKVDELLKEHATASILTTGHSLGGALSQIGGLRLKQKFNVQVDIHNFGCPRVGNAAMAQYISSRTNSLYRVVHHKDIVPHLPPESYLYHHSAYEVFFDEKFISYVICSDSGEDKNCSNQFAPNYSAADHGFYFLDLGTLKC